MKDRTPTKVLENGAVRYGIYDEMGLLLRYEYIRSEDEPTQSGTPLTKMTLLSDETAEAIGLDQEDPTVNDALSGLAAGKQDSLTGLPGQVPVFNADGVLEARDYSSSIVFAFTAEEWGPPASWAPEEPAEGEEAAAYDGSLGYEITVPAETHKRKTGDFGFHVFHQVDGRYITNTWAAIGTGANYDGKSGTVTLFCSAPYPGKILFVG